MKLTLKAFGMVIGAVAAISSANAAATQTKSVTPVQGATMRVITRDIAQSNPALASELAGAFQKMSLNSNMVLNSQGQATMVFKSLIKGHEAAVEKALKAAKGDFNSLYAKNLKGIQADAIQDQAKMTMDVSSALQALQAVQGKTDDAAAIKCDPDAHKQTVKAIQTGFMTREFYGLKGEVTPELVSLISEGVKDQELNKILLAIAQHQNEFVSHALEVLSRDGLTDQEKQDISDCGGFMGLEKTVEDAAANNKVADRQAYIDQSMQNAPVACQRELGIAPRVLKDNGKFCLELARKAA